LHKLKIVGARFPLKLRGSVHNFTSPVSGLNGLIPDQPDDENATWAFRVI